MTPPATASETLVESPPRRRRRLVRVAATPLRFGEWLSKVVERLWRNVFTALVQIWANKARSILTTLGIIIAVTSTITVVSFVQGFGNYVTDVIRGLGTNMIFVIPEFPSGRRGRMISRVVMDIGDVRAVGSQCDKVRCITPFLFFPPMTVEYGREKTDEVFMRGSTEQFQSIFNFFVDEGRFFGPIDVDQATHVCVLGSGVLKLLQADENIVGDYIYLDQLRFKVLGILGRKGNMLGNDQDFTVIVPYTTAVKMSPFLRRFMPFAVEATGEADVEEASLQITRVLRQRHNLQPGQPNDFRVLRQDEFLRDFEQIKVVVTSVLAAIVGISLVVGGIGIMNVMLVSVSERTREIGLRKAVGGRRRDIMSQFLTEAVTLATVGGLIGIFLGYAICAIASKHPNMVNITVPPWIVAVALSFSAGVGVLFGLIPAFKAAILHPIDALRHE